MTKQKNKTAPLIVLGLIFLFNPNIQVVDLLPDFVAYFIFARLLEKPALMAPYFEEARSTSLKLALLSLAKIPAFVLAIFIRSKNTLDNDIFPLLALVFATLEIILCLTLIKNLSSAFFHLGERASARSLITPFSLSKAEKREMRPEDLKNMTAFFVIAKCLLYTLPEFLLLTRTADNGLIMPSPLAKLYPIALLICLALGSVIGVTWLIRSRKYLDAVIAEGEFTRSLNFLKSETSEAEYNIRVKLRRTNKALFALAAASIFTYPMIFEDAELINIFPGFIFAAILIYSFSKLRPLISKSIIPTLISSGAYAATSLLAFVFSVRFLKKYDYIDIANKLSASNHDVLAAYVGVVITAAIEFIAITVFFAFALKYMRSFILENTGLSPESDRYSRTESDYHKSLMIKLYLFFGFAFLAALLKFVEICLFLSPKIHYNITSEHLSVVTSSAVPWFGILVAAASILFIGYALYFTHILREEIEMKYKNE